MARAPGEPGNPPVLKRYGQHFLTDRKILTAIVDALDPGASDTVVEIGPGRGSLTEILAARTGRLVGIEIDRALAAQLRKTFASKPNVQIVEGDVLETDIRSLVGKDFLLIGNVPYYITTPIVFKALEPPMPARSVFLVQSEVADRMGASENTESYGALSINIAVVARAERVLDVAASAFRPPPKVESAVVRIIPLARPLVPVETLEAFRTFVQAVFGLRRKQMLRVLRTVRGLSVAPAERMLADAVIETDARPETISPERFAKLFSLVSGATPPD
ncbi:MAG TPA: 16S rRNA (adenine(1518)-N(6)/adenine(1519)-N(6))-dimethyltransferase RsmA [Gemmatimonadaceae bacterium]|nr:16S rRNA (adenine(1518)-N(6)/adenine(1519)-N(6))-dimethyltransferase RsmA [Gemmatimonadaceae bacterium]